MTTTVAVAPSRASTPSRRAWNVMRMQMANPFNTLVVPWLITLAVFALNIAIQLIVVKAAGGTQNLEPDAFQYNGGITWIAVFMMVTAVQTMNLTFRYALGLSVTRRDFYLGSAVYFVLLTLIYATGITAFAALESATDGWGINSAFFAPWGLSELPLITLWAVYAMVLLLFFFLGAAVATVWVRWKAYGLYTFFLGLAVLLVGSLWLITANDAWGEVADYLTDHSLIQIVAWTVPVTVLCAVVGYLFLRRATPRA